MSAAQAERQQVLSSVELASPGVRLGARFFDDALYLLPAIVAASIGDSGVDEDTKGILGLAMFGWWFCVAVMQAVLISTQGKSLGKKIFGIKLIRHNGQEVGFLHGWFVRSFLYGLLAGTLNLIFFFIPALVDSLMIFSDNHQTLLDRIASTYVIVDR